MTTKAHTSKTVFETLIQPLTGLIQQCKHKRKYNALSDQEWIETGSLRTVWSQERTGRAFLQKLFDSGRSVLKGGHFFETLKSGRRLKLCREVNLLLYEKMMINRHRTDPFASFPALDEYDIPAGHGRYHAAACHDVKKSEKKYLTRHAYSVELRSHALRHLTSADTSGTRKKEHDIHALKRLDIETLRQSAPKGRKVVGRSKNPRAS